MSLDLFEKLAYLMRNFTDPQGTILEVGHTEDLILADEVTLEGKEQIEILAKARAKYSRDSRFVRAR